MSQGLSGSLAKSSCAQQVCVRAVPSPALVLDSLRVSTHCLLRTAPRTKVYNRHCKNATPERFHLSNSRSYSKHILWDFSTVPALTFLQYKAGRCSFTSVLPHISESSSTVPCNGCTSSGTGSRFFFTVKGVCRVLVGGVSSFFLTRTLLTAVENYRIAFGKITLGKDQAGNISASRWLFLKIMSIWTQFWNLNWGTLDQASFLQQTFLFITSNFIMFYKFTQIFHLNVPYCFQDNMSNSDTENARYILPFIFIFPWNKKP